MGSLKNQVRPPLRQRRPASRSSRRAGQGRAGGCRFAATSPGNAQQSRPPARVPDHPSNADPLAKLYHYCEVKLPPTRVSVTRGAGRVPLHIHTPASASSLSMCALSFGFCHPWTGSVCVSQTDARGNLLSPSLYRSLLSVRIPCAGPRGSLTTAVPYLPSRPRCSLFLGGGGGGGSEWVGGGSGRKRCGK